MPKGTRRRKARIFGTVKQCMLADRENDGFLLVLWA